MVSYVRSLQVLTISKKLNRLKISNSWIPKRSEDTGQTYTPKMRETGEDSSARTGKPELSLMNFWRGSVDNSELK